MGDFDLGRAALTTEFSDPFHIAVEEAVTAIYLDQKGSFRLWVGSPICRYCSTTLIMA